jgi:hypothetical protein
MSKVKEYRECAERCERLARDFRDPQLQDQMRTLAAAWRSLADEAERLGLGGEA